MKTKSTGAVKKSGNFQGKSNKLGFGGRAAQLKSKGVPGGVIGNLARKAKAAPGQANFHGGKKSVPQRKPNKAMSAKEKLAKGMKMLGHGHA